MVAINRINRRGCRWVSKITDVEVLQKVSGHQTSLLVEAVAKAMGNQVARSDDLLGGLKELTSVLASVDGNLSKMYNLLNAKIWALK